MTLRFYIDREKNQGHVDALSRLPMDKVKFSDQEKTILQTAEDTTQVLEHIHKDGHFGVKKTLKLDGDSKECGRKPSVKQLSCLARVDSSVPITNPEPCPKGRSNRYPLGMS